MYKFTPNKKYSGKLYNEERKERFLDEGGYEEGTKNTYRSVFKSSFKEEDRLKKDLCDFNLDEIDNIMYNLEPLTEASSKGKLSIIETYIRWAINKGLREGSNINPLDTIPNDYAKQFINKHKKLYLSWDDVYERIIPELVNYQDKVILSLLFEGVEGQDSSELRFLKKSDVNFETGELTLHDHKSSGITKRVLKVSDECLEIIQGAIDEKKYSKNNGTTRDNYGSLKDYLDLIETGYVIKVAKSRTATLGGVRSSVIRQRLTALKNHFGDVIEEITPRSIIKSGQIYWGYSLLKEQGVLEKEQYIHICERFNEPLNNSNGYEYYNWNKLKEWVNLENIAKMYSDII